MIGTSIHGKLTADSVSGTQIESTRNISNKSNSYKDVPNFTKTTCNGSYHLLIGQERKN